MRYLRTRSITCAILAVLVLDGCTYRWHLEPNAVVTQPDLKGKLQIWVDGKAGIYDQFRTSGDSLYASYASNTGVGGEYCRVNSCELAVSLHEIDSVRSGGTANNALVGVALIVFLGAIVAAAGGVDGGVGGGGFGF